MSAPAPMEGFTIQAADAWWIGCRICGTNELVYGLFAATDASTWASQHLREEHPEQLIRRPS